jgi:hypothetical protein
MAATSDRAMLLANVHVVTTLFFFDGETPGTRPSP